MIITHNHKDGSHWNIHVDHNFHPTTGRYENTQLRFYYSGIADNNRLVNTLTFKTAAQAGLHIDTFITRCKQADAA